MTKSTPFGPEDKAVDEAILEDVVPSKGVKSSMFAKSPMESKFRRFGRPM